MYEVDHMLNGKESRQHHQQMIREAQYEKFARAVETAKSHPIIEITIIYRATMTGLRFESK